MKSEKEISNENRSSDLGRRLLRRMSALYSYFSFSYIGPFLAKGAKGNIDVNSAAGYHPQVETIEHTSATFSRIYEALRVRYSADKDSRRNLVMRAIISQNCLRLCVQFCWGLAESVLRLSGPVFLRLYLRWLDDYNNDKADFTDGWKWGFLLCLCPLLFALSHHRLFWVGFLAGYKTKMSMMATVHSKLLRLNSSSVAKITTGHVVNLASNDVQRFEDVFCFWLYIILGPLEAIAVLIMISFVLGFLPAVSGVSCILFLVPLQSVLSRKVAKYRGKVAKVTDRRINFMGELISGNLAVKMLGWEEPLLKDVNSVRDKEHSLLRKVSYVSSSMMALSGYIQTVMVCITFVVYRFTGDEFNIPDVFFAISLMTLPRLTMSLFFNLAVQHLTEVVVSTKRLDDFFRLPEPQTHDREDKKSVSTGEVLMKHGNYGWYGTKEDDLKKKKSMKIIERVLSKVKSKKKDSEHTSPQLIQSLTDIGFHIQPGELIGIAGKVGSGKSSVLLALLNDMENMDKRSSAKLSGAVAYCAQVPWIVEATVRENITFGQQFDPEFYAQVVSSCALDVDFEQFPLGDETELGERGINLSGGQKARIALARAAYCKADINLLDDPLSAVDPRVGKILFDKCIGGSEALMKNTTRLLVTHQRQFLPFCDRIIWMHDGKIECIGTWDQLVEQHVLESMEETDDLSHAISLDAVSGGNSSPREDTKKTHTAGSSSDLQQLQSSVKEKSIKISDREKHLVEEEGKESGKVTWKVYWDYIVRIGVFSSFFTFALLIASKVLYFIAEWWVALWASTDQDDQEENKWVWVLMALTAAVVITVSLSIFFVFGLLISGSSQLHKNMARRVIHAPLKFFHTNPTGRVLNRFSKDTGVQDDELPMLVADYLLVLLNVLGTMILVSVALPYLIPVFLIIAWLFMKIRTHFVTTLREVKRFEAVTRSPIYAMLSSNIKGLATIKAYKNEKEFQKDFFESLEMNGSWWLGFLSISRWVGVRMDAISALICFVSIVVATSMANYISVEIVGLALTYVIGLSGSMQWCIRQSAELESKMTAVERTLEYTRLEQEPPKASEGGGKAPEDWPAAGKIDYSCVTASYRQGLDPVLTDLEFTIPGGSSVGIVGRTGSGKSSLLLTLFRLIDLNEGQIFVDDIDTSKIGIDVLRRQLAIIPQDPVLFGGTIKSNLDPWNEYSDARIWRALKEVRLDDAVRSCGGLSSRILESGHNLSVGQRQLLCLARALLTDSKILALDEATANVDRTTDALIQESLHSLITRNDKTLLIIAHRIDTVLDCDLLLVLDDGKKVEFGSPDSLLNKPDGVFRSMVDAAKKAS